MLVPLGRHQWGMLEFKDLGTNDVYFDSTYENTPLDTKYNQVHIPGANGRGTNYVVTQDRVYIVEGSTCHVLDSVTGEDLKDIRLPAYGDTSVFTKMCYWVGMPLHPIETDWVCRLSQTRS